MIPLYHDFSDATVLVVGGGSVGARKAKRFASEAAVVVVSPEFDSRFADEEFPAVERIRAAPSVDDAAAWLDRTEPALVVAATNDGDLNAALADAAAERDILVNRTDRSGDRDIGSVVVPATVDDDPVSVAISTGGRSPALSRYLRQQIEGEIENAGAMAELTGQLRAELQATKPPAERRAAIREVVRSPSVWKALHSGIAKGRDEATRVMRQDDHGDDGGDAE